MSTLLGKTLFLFRVVFVLIVLIFFIIYFGIPSIEQYLRKETIFIETQRDYLQSDFPHISVTRFPHNENTKEECYSKKNLTNLMDCLSENTYDLNNTILDMRQQIYQGAYNSVDYTKWQLRYMIAYWGRTYTWKEKYVLSDTDYARIILPSNGKYIVEFHDKSHYVETSEQYEDFQRVTIIIEKGKKYDIFLRTEEINSLPEVTNCNSDDSYSFLSCAKVC